MKVSIVVPAYNEEAFLAKTLQSIRNQAYKDFELIVVNNNSSDRTKDIALAFTDIVLDEKKPGYIHAVRRGVEAATGELITFCDADAIYPENWLHKMIFEFRNNPDAVAVYGSCSTHDSWFLMNLINQFFYTQFLRLSRALGLDNTSGFNFVMKRATYLKVGGYDPAYQQMSPDIELGKRLSKEGPIIFKPKITVKASFRRFQDKGIIKTQIMFMKAWWEMLRGKPPSVDYSDYNK